ncbi:MAG: hypothetical protein AUK55_06565 [Syntrophobacteraceae bacterium CG2_30_61_12]|nr:MAG: hypothetical protein AUK55_06565 [Syntrophobacteraceae bacterium CG2_30_61_12]
MQLEAAITVILNKLDQASPEQLVAVRKGIAELVPPACGCLGPPRPSAASSSRTILPDGGS